MLTKDEKKTLIKIARNTLNDHIQSNKIPPLPELTENLKEIRGAFVTLKMLGELRGCIGNIIGRKPLAETVRDMAIASATEDPRFPRVRPEEVDKISIEISALTPLEEIKAENVEVGKHGLLITKGYRSGVLLPQVPLEYNWTRREFLEHTCFKAGLSKDAWLDPETTIEAFTAEVFNEDEN